MSASFTRRARYLTFAGLATLGLATVAQLAVSPSAMSADTYTVPLHNTSTNDTGDCPGSPAQFGWHFVVPGEGGEFVSLTVQFQEAGTITTTTFGPPTAKHAYVYTPTADTLLSGTATITGGDAEFFVLSHTCTGGGTETETPTPTVSATETTAAPTTPVETTTAAPTSSAVETTTAAPTSSAVETTTAAPTSSTGTPEVSGTVIETTSAAPTSSTGTPEVSGTVVETTTPGATVLPTVITNTPTGTETETATVAPSVQGVKVVRPSVRGTRLATTGTPVPVALLLLLGFGLVGAGVLATVAGERQVAPGIAGRHRR